MSNLRWLERCPRTLGNAEQRKCRFVAGHSGECEATLEEKPPGPRETVHPRPWEKYGIADEAATIWEWIEKDLGFQSGAPTAPKASFPPIIRVPEYVRQAVTRAWEEGHDHGRAIEFANVRRLAGEIVDLRHQLEALVGRVLEIARSTSPRRFLVRELLRAVGGRD